MSCTMAQRWQGAGGIRASFFSGRSAVSASRATQSSLRLAVHTGVGGRPGVKRLPGAFRPVGAGAACLPVDSQT